MNETKYCLKTSRDIFKESAYIKRHPEFYEIVKQAEENFKAQGLSPLEIDYKVNDMFNKAYAYEKRLNSNTRLRNISSSFLKFLLLLIVKLFIQFASILLIAYVIISLPNSPFLSWLINTLSDGSVDAFASQVAIMASFAVSYLIADKINAYRPLVTLCSFDIVVNIVFLISNIIHNEWFFPNIISLVFALSLRSIAKGNITNN